MDHNTKCELVTVTAAIDDPDVRARLCDWLCMTRDGLMSAVEYQHEQDDICCWPEGNESTGTRIVFEHRDSPPGAMTDVAEALTAGRWPFDAYNAGDDGMSPEMRWWRPGMDKSEVKQLATGGDDVISTLEVRNVLDALASVTDADKVKKAISHLVAPPGFESDPIRNYGTKPPPAPESEARSAAISGGVGQGLLAF